MVLPSRRLEVRGGEARGGVDECAAAAHVGVPAVAAVAPAREVAGAAAAGGEHTEYRPPL